MKQSHFNPKETHFLTSEQLEEFFYATDKAVYEPFFDLSSTLVTERKAVAKIVLSNDCDLNCEFCDYRKENNLERFFLSENQLKGLLDLAHELNIKEIVIESGVMSDSHFNQFRAYQDILSSYPFMVYLDIGSETIIRYPELLNWDCSFFVDYSPQHESFRATLEIFRNRKEILNLIHSRTDKDFYGNFIVDLAGQEFIDIIDDFKELINKPFKGIKISPFLGKPNTPFSIFGEGCFLTTLKVVSLSRLLNPNVDIFINDTIEELQYDDCMKKALNYGGNKAVISLNDQTDKAKWAKQLETFHIK